MVRRDDPTRRWRLGLATCAATLALAVGGMPACGDSGGGGPVDDSGAAETGVDDTLAGDETAEVDDTSAVEEPEEIIIPDWHQSMQTGKLIEIANQIGLDVDEDSEHGYVVSVLEDATGCGCFGMICGTGACGHDCGGDSCLEGQVCYSGNCEPEGSCPMLTTEMLFEDALYYDNGKDIEIRYTAEVASDGINRIRIWSTRDSDDKLGPGTYQIRSMDPWDCELCAAAYRDCNATGCKEAFLTQVGWVELEEAKAWGDFVGSLHEAKFQKVDGDPYSGVFDLVPKAESMCVEEFVFDGPMASTVVVDPTSCDQGGTGTKIGDNIENFSVKNCYGEDVELYDYCGANAVWIVAVAGW